MSFIAMGNIEVLHNIKSFFKEFLINKNILITRPTDPVLLKQFFLLIRPITTNHKLIRIGGNADGGYLIPDDLNGINACFSPGVSEVADFELELAGMGIKSFLADYSVEAPPVEHELFDFEKKFLGPVEGGIFITLEDWVKRKAPNEKELILQMDIEGAEYEVILDTSGDILKHFRIIVIEFHGLDALYNKFGFDIINVTFKKLLKYFEIIHIHPNNSAKPFNYKEYEIPPIMEFTFIRKDRVTEQCLTTSFPHELDRACVLTKKDYSLPQCWFTTPV